MVSIIMPSYNSARFIGESIESIIAQSCGDWELLIADDCSTDNSCEVIEKYCQRDKRVKLIQLDSNSGAAVARNRAIKEAQGRYIAFCDSDDRWMPHKLERQIEFMTQQSIEVCFSSYYHCNESGDKIIGEVVAPSCVTLNSTISCDYMGTLTFIYDTKNIGKIEMPLLRKRQDWALKILVMQRGCIAKSVAEPLAYYRVREGSISSSKFDLVKYNVAVYRDVLKYSNLKAWLVFIFRFMPCYIVKRIKFKQIK